MDKIGKDNKSLAKVILLASPANEKGIITTSITLDEKGMGLEKLIFN